MRSVVGKRSWHRSPLLPPLSRTNQDGVLGCVRSVFNTAAAGAYRVYYSADGDIDAAFAGADAVHFWTYLDFVPQYLSHRQLKPTLTRYERSCIRVWAGSQRPLLRPAAVTEPSIVPWLS